MTPEQLKQRLPLGFKDSEFAAERAKELGNKLRAHYRDLAEGFRNIAYGAGAPRAAQSVTWSGPINLGVYDHPDLGSLRCSATVTINEYNPDRRNSCFSVQTSFTGRTSRGHFHQLALEEFGPGRINYFGNHTPAFVRNPRTACTEPWDSSRIDDGPIWPIDRTWTLDAYGDILRSLSPMMRDAEDTQQLLISAMRDGSLNPAMADRAQHLTIPGHLGIAA